MRTVLIGWELGAGRGHAERLVPIVASYRARGWHVVAALRDARLGANVLGPHQSEIRNGKLTITRAPIFSHFEVEGGPVHSLAEILVKTGFGKRDLVEPLVRAWEAILHRHQPDVVISDSAPSLNVVARGRMPLIVIGNGWTIPPDTDPPATFLRVTDGGLSIRNAADAVLSAMNAAAPGDNPAQRFSQLLRGDLNIVCSLGETDPYYEQRREKLYWPFEISEPRTMSVGRRSGVLVYLPRDHLARPLVEKQAVNWSEQLDAFFNDGVERISGNIRIHGQPLNFENIIPQKRVVIHHGGLGTAIWCIVNRIPQIILPDDLEKQLVAMGVSAGGFGISLSYEEARDHIGARINVISNIIVPQFDSAKMVTLSSLDSIEALISAAPD